MTKENVAAGEGTPRLALSVCPSPPLGGRGDAHRLERPATGPPSWECNTRICPAVKQGNPPPPPPTSTPPDKKRCCVHCRRRVLFFYTKGSGPVTKTQHLKPNKMTDLGDFIFYLWRTTIRQFYFWPIQVKKKTRLIFD